MVAADVVSAAVAGYCDDVLTAFFLLLKINVLKLLSKHMCVQCTHYFVEMFLCTKLPKIYILSISKAEVHVYENTLEHS